MELRKAFWPKPLQGGGLLKIGEYAELHSVSSKMLRHYDEIGLFHPERVETDTGYRLYSNEQNPRLQWILTLKSLGFSLEEIRELLTGPVDSGKVLRALFRKKMEITREFQASLVKSLQIQKLLSIIEREGFMMDKTIDLSKLDICELTAIKKNMPNMDMLVDDVQTLLKKGLKGKTFGFIRYDLRKFIEINEKDGYEVGDRVIVALYKILEDILGEHGLQYAIARAGGDEFLVFLEGSPEEVRSVARTIMDRVRAIDYKAINCHRPIDGYVGAVTASADSTCHLRELIDDTFHALRDASQKVKQGEEGIVIVSKS